MQATESVNLKQERINPSVLKESSLSVVKEKKEVQAFRDYLASGQAFKAIRDVLPSHKKKDVERILRIALIEYANNSALHECSLSSVKMALMNACRLGLEVGPLTGHAFFIPYKGRCTLQIGYKGLVEMAYKMGTVRSIRARTVYENDEFEIIGGTEDSINHKICLGDKGKVIGYYVVVDLQESRPVFHYMSVNEINDHRQKFCRNGGDFWSKFPEQMAYKTIFIKLFKWLPNNTFLKDVSEIESEEGFYHADMKSLPSQTRAAKIAEEIEEVEED
jgi:recombination protein RecT